MSARGQDISACVRGIFYSIVITSLFGVSAAGLLSWPCSARLSIFYNENLELDTEGLGKKDYFIYAENPKLPNNGNIGADQIKIPLPCAAKQGGYGRFEEILNEGRFHLFQEALNLVDVLVYLDTGRTYDGVDQAKQINTFFGFDWRRIFLTARL